MPVSMVILTLHPGGHQDVHGDGVWGAVGGEGGSQGSEASFRAGQLNLQGSKNLWQKEMPAPTWPTGYEQAG